MGKEIVSEVFIIEGRIKNQWKNLGLFSTDNLSLDQVLNLVSQHEAFLCEFPAESPFDEFRVIKRTSEKVYNTESLLIDHKVQK